MSKFHFINSRKLTLADNHNPSKRRLRAPTNQRNVNHNRSTLSSVCVQNRYYKFLKKSQMKFILEKKRRNANWKSWAAFFDKREKNFFPYEFFEASCLTDPVCIILHECKQRRCEQASKQLALGQPFYQETAWRVFCRRALVRWQKS